MQGKSVRAKQNEHSNKGGEGVYKKKGTRPSTLS